MKKILLVIAFCVPGISQAGLFVEPGITYQYQDTTVDYSSVFNQSTGKNNGLGLSARIGFDASDIVFVGVDARYAMTQFQDSAFNTDVKAKSYNLGPVVGIQMPIVGLKVWAGYVLSGEVDPEKVTTSTLNYDAKFSGGKGYRIGAGFHFVVLSVNLEYQDLKYDNITADVTPGGAITLNGATEKGLVLGLSFPIGL
jgi:hypothetical protein